MTDGGFTTVHVYCALVCGFLALSVHSAAGQPAANSADPTPESQVAEQVALGDTYLESGSYARAYREYSAARDVARRAFGLSDLSQVPIVRKMGDAAAAAGDSAGAIDLQREALGLVYTAHRSRSVEGLEATRFYADWLAAHGHFRDAGSQYGFASNLVRIVSPEDVEEAVALLRLAADNTFLAEVLTPLGSNRRAPDALIRALTVIEPDLNVRAVSAVRPAGDGALENGCVDLGRINPDRVDQPLLVAEFLRDIGDWCVALDIPQLFGNAHIAAWDLLAAVDDGENIRAAWFADSPPLYVPALRSPALSQSEDAPVGRIELRFAVDEKGTTQRVEIVGSDPAGLIDGDATRTIENSRFRPRIEDGRFVTWTTSMSFEFRFDPESIR